MSEPKITYFSCLNANQRIAGVAFEPIDIFAGSVSGVLATTDQALIASLSNIPHVTEITQQEYEDQLKKKAPSFSALKHSNAISSSPGVPLKEIAGVVVEGQSNPTSSAPAAESILEARPIETPASPGRSRKPRA